jgi:hypothetical protein
MKRTPIIQARKELPAAKTVRKILLICGILASLLYGGTDIIAGLLKPVYRFDSQSASVLSAFGTTTRPFVLPLNLTADIFLIAFALGVWFSTDHNWVLRVMTGLLAGNAVFSMGAVAFFPLHLGEAMSTLSNTMNVILMGVGVLLLLLAIGFGAVVYQNWFRLYSIGTLLTFLVLSIWGLLVVPLIATPVSRIGVQERIMFYGCLLWVVVLAISLLRTGKNTVEKTIRKTMVK